MRTRLRLKRPPRGALWRGAAVAVVPPILIGGAAVVWMGYNPIIFALGAGLFFGAPVIALLICRNIWQQSQDDPDHAVRPVRLALRYALIAHGIATLVLVLIGSLAAWQLVLMVLLNGLFCLLAFTLPAAALGGWLFRLAALERYQLDHRDELLSQPTD